MTVLSLWSTLEEAGCGIPVGSDDFSLRGRGDNPDQQSVLAVDLSIWVCEGIASTALSSFHSDPALHLVYQRTTKLLKLGLGLVFVVEGQRRVRSKTIEGSQAHELKQRRSGSQFWNASKRCEAMLKCLSVPVVCAEAEGEALCALLNLKGLVDGIISNDGDCFLFGAKTVYTKFSAENLAARKVIRYDSKKLAAKLDGDSSRTIKLSREDLIAFAMLTGSDLVGNGIAHIGGRKAIQYLHACRSLNDSYSEGTCLDELLSWGDVAVDASKLRDICVDCDDDGPSTISSRFCSVCLHAGDKKQHEKHGCAECGTGPGEGCYVVTSSEKLLRSLKEKAQGTIAPRHIVNGYFSPNNNIVPSSLKSLGSKPYVVSVDGTKLFTSESMILKGKSRECSQEYVKQTLPKLLARLDLWDTGPRNRYATTKLLRYKPIPMRINKSLVKQSWQCYEITWSININPSSKDDHFQFCTFECQSLVNSNFPRLVKAFHQEERRKQQGRAEDERRKQFIGTNNNAGKRNNKCHRPDFSKKLQRQGHRNKRERKFDVGKVRKVQKTSVDQAPSNDVSMLLDSLHNNKPVVGNGEVESKLFEECGEKDCQQLFALDDFHEEVFDFESASADNDKSVSIEDDKPNHYEYNHGLKSCAEDPQYHHSRHVNLSGEQDNPIDRRGWDGRTSRCHIEQIGHDEVCLQSKDVDQQALHRTGLHRLLPDEQPFQQVEDRYLDDILYGGPWDDTSKRPFQQDGCSWEDMRKSTDDTGGTGRNDGDLCSTHLNQNHFQRDTQGDTTHHLSPSTRVYCDMGIQIEVTPITSSRWKFF